MIETQRSPGNGNESLSNKFNILPGSSNTHHTQAAISAGILDISYLLS